MWGVVEKGARMVVEEVQLVTLPPDFRRKRGEEPGICIRCASARRLGEFCWVNITRGKDVFAVKEPPEVWASGSLGAHACAPSPDSGGGRSLPDRGQPSSSELEGVGSGGGPERMAGLKDLCGGKDGANLPVDIIEAERRWGRPNRWRRRVTSRGSCRRWLIPGRRTRALPMVWPTRFG